MHNKSKSNHPNPPPKLETFSKYINFIDYRKRNLLSTNYQNEEQPNLIINHIDRIVPLVHTNRGMISQRKEKNKINLQLNKKDIKQKIKDRIKAQIENLIQRNTFKVNKPQNQYKQTRQISPENVSIIGSSVPRLIGYNTQIKQKQQKGMTKSQIFEQIIQRSRKVRSSLGPRLQQQRPQIKLYKQKAEKMQLIYRRSMSTDIRIKNIGKRKPSESEIGRKIQKNKQQMIQPWVIANFVDEQQIF